jgi:hypothetical protein
MEELLELKNLLLAGNVPDALILVEEMTTQYTLMGNLYF